MNITKEMYEYICHSKSLWDNQLTELLVEGKTQELLKKNYGNPTEYNITNSILNSSDFMETGYNLIENGSTIFIAFPTKSLNHFYKEHFLKPVKINLDSKEIFQKIKSAMAVFKHVESLQSIILNIVKSIQIIQSDHSDSDTSYSHPDIPFSIFISVCEETSVISDLRVAESILHESMHLFLTLIENQCALIVCETKEVFFSPWRDENRPVRGVLHGMFVFSAIRNFYIELISTNSFLCLEHLDFINFRIKEITKEIKQLDGFQFSNGLTSLGKSFASKLTV